MCFDKKTLAVCFSGIIFFDGILALLVALGWAQISLGSWTISATEAWVIFVFDMIISALLFWYGTKTVKSIKKVRK